MDERREDDGLQHPLVHEGAEPDAVDSDQDGDEKATWSELEPAWDNYFSWDDQVVAWVSDGTDEGYRTAVESIKPIRIANWITTSA